jgi:hypothetical protein
MPIPFNARPFWFKPGHYDFWPLYQALARYYPMGIRAQEYGQEDPLLETYPGYQEMGTLIQENIVNRKQYRERWGSFLKQLKADFQLPVREPDTDLLVPSFSGLLQLKKTQQQDSLYLKELHFSVSLLGPFYTLFGMDKSVLPLPNPYAFPQAGGQTPQTPYEAIHALTVSPFEEYSELFGQLQDKIRERFSGYKFVPYHIHCMYLEGLRLGGPGTEESSLYQLFFNNLLDRRIPSRGDGHWGYADWQRHPG